MSKLVFEVDHQLDVETVKKRLNDLIEERLSQLDRPVQIDRKEWLADELHFSGSSSGLEVSGVLRVEGNRVVAALRLPLLAKPFKSMILDRLKEEIGNALK